MATGFEIGIFGGKILWDCVKLSITSLFSGINKEMTDAMYNAAHEAANKFFDKYGNKYGRFENSFLAKQSNWDVILKLVYLSSKEINIKQIDPRGDEGIVVAPESVIADFLQMLEKEMRDNICLDAMLTMKEILRLEKHSNEMISKLMSKQASLYSEATVAYNKFGLGERDQTTEPKHFWVFNSNSIFVDAIFVEPLYEIIHYNHGCRELESDIKQTNFLDDCLELLKRQKILFLIGPYGSGKTFLSKWLQLKLQVQKIDVVFINCSDIKDLTSELDLTALVKERKQDSKELFIVFDGYDEVNFIKKEEGKISDRILQNIIRLSSLDGIYLILNTRDILHANADIYYDLNVAMCDNRKEMEAYFLCLKYFDRNRIDQWLKNYCIEMNTRGNSQSLDRTRINNIHKNLLTACTNPLFLYMVTILFFEHGNIKDIYDLYESFVQNTVKGKFDFEKFKGAASLGDVVANYREILRGLAVLIAKKNYLQVETIHLDDWYLESNKFNYHIDINDVTEEIVERITTIKNSIEGYDKRKLVGTVLNCYFLEETSEGWKFRDNNILYFLIAEHYFISLNNMIKKFKITNDSWESFKEVYALGDIMIHPLSIEMLLKKLDTIGERKASLSIVIQKLLESGRVLNIKQGHFEGLTTSKINLDLLCCLIYMRLKTDSYIALDYYFKRLNWYISCAKQLNYDYLHLVRRFFRFSKLYHIDFARINYSGYNFSNTQISDCNFYQCKFHDTLMNKVNFKNVCFELCDISDLDLSNVKGSLEFKNCIIDKLFIGEVTGGTSLKFSRCLIKKLEFQHCNQSLFISFYRCDISKFLFINCIKSNEIIIEEGFYPTLEAEGSKLKVKTNISVKYEPSTNKDISILKQNSSPKPI
jgi:DNA replication protein DnaC